jgi:sugar phosphate isomerase/epimerase
MVLHVENEPVCNVRTLGDLDALMRSWRHPRLKALLDIGNAASAGAPATVAGVASLAPHVDQAHFKDYSKARRAYVALGEGDIPYRELLAPCLAEARTRELVLTVETHVPGDRPDATRRSLAELRRLAAGAA